MTLVPRAAQPAAQLPRRWFFAHLALDEAQGRLLVSGRETPIQPLPFKLLRSLLAAAPGVVSRDTLLTQLWNRVPNLVSRNALSNAVARLRDIIGDTDGQLVITIAKTGYGLRGPVTWQPVAAISPPDSAQACADQYMARMWQAALNGVRGRDAHLGVYGVVCSRIKQAEAELADQPMTLAAIHQTLAQHCLVRWDLDAAILHYQRALSLCSAPPSAAIADFALQVHFDLARTLATSVVFSGNSQNQNLQKARHELDLAHAALQRSPQASPVTWLRAHYAAWFLAFYEADWPRALAFAERVLSQANTLAELDVRHWWEYHANHALTLMRAGHEQAAVQALTALLDHAARPLDSGDIVHLTTRMNLGAVYVLVGRPADAALRLEPLHAELRTSEGPITAIEIQVSIWLAQAWAGLGRRQPALQMLQGAHAQAVQQRGVSSETAMQALVPLTTLMDLAGDTAAALRLLESGLTPRLAGLSMPGQRYAVLALAHWVDLLLQAGEHATALGLLQHLRPQDLRTAVLRPDEAAVFFARWRKVLPLPRPVQTHCGDSGTV